MNNSYNNYEDEREIDLIDLIGRMIAKWRIICIAAVIGLVAGVVLFSIKGYSDMRSSNAESIRISALKTEELAAEKLLQEESGERLKGEADANLVRYVAIQEMCDVQKEYNENSVYNNLDASNISRVNLTYYIDNSYTDANTYNNISDIVDAYKVILTSDDVLSEVAEAAGTDIKPEYLRELVVVNDELDDIADDVAESNYKNTSGYTINNVTVNTTIKESKPSGGNLSIDIYTDNEELSEEIAECYIDIVERVTLSELSDYGNVEALLQNAQFYTGSNLKIMNDQYKAGIKLADGYKELREIEKTMVNSEPQLDYFKAILASHNLGATEVSAQQYGLMYFISKVKILIVAVGAAFIAVCVFGAMYLFDGKVKTSGELASVGKSALLGTVLVDNDKKHKNILFDKWAIALTDAKTMCDDSDRKLQTVSATVIQYLKTNGLHNVTLAGADIKHEDIVASIMEDVITAGYNANIAIDAFDSPETVNNIAESDAVVFIGEICSSKYRKLDRVLALCRLYKKPIIGTVAIQERI